MNASIEQMATKISDCLSIEELLVIDDLLKEVMHHGTIPGQTIAEQIHLCFLKSNKVEAMSLEEVIHQVINH